VLLVVPPPAPPAPQHSTKIEVTPAGTVNVPEDVNICVWPEDDAEIKKNMPAKMNNLMVWLNLFIL
jgi:hypothetical protein